MSKTAFIVLMIISISIVNTQASPQLGVSYTHSSKNNLTSILSMIQSLNIQIVRLTNPEPVVIQAFQFSNISLLLDVPNNVVLDLANKGHDSFIWMNQNVIRMSKLVNISCVSIGYNVYQRDPESTLRAIENAHLFLRAFRISGIKVSTTFGFLNVVNFTSMRMPSLARFNDGLVLKPLLDVLEATNSSFLVDITPYHLYMARMDVQAEFAAFVQSKVFIDDIHTGFRYENLFQIMLEAVYASLGYKRIDLIVLDSGWPSSDSYAQRYIQGLINHLSTTKAMQTVSQVYVSPLVDSDENDLGSYENNLKKKFEIVLPSSFHLETMVDQIIIKFKEVGFALVAMLVASLESVIISRVINNVPMKIDPTNFIDLTMEDD